MIRATPEIIRANVPACLRELPQWVCWRIEDQIGKFQKVPLCPEGLFRASSTERAQWRSFDLAMSAFESEPELMGVGFVFSSADPFCGIDLDDCRDTATGEIAAWAREIIDSFASYCEVSPSGTGVKIFVRGKKKGARCRKKCESGEVEMYDSDRFFTVTGEWLRDDLAEVVEAQEALDSLYAKVFGDEAESPVPLSLEDEPVELTDDEIIRHVSSSRAKNEKFAALWQGRWNDYYNSASEADSSLVFKLAYFTKDAAQIDRVFRRSGLYRDKWDELHGQETYGATTVRKALSKVQGQYRPKKRSRRPATPSPSMAGLPGIGIDEVQLADLTQQALGAISAANTPPSLFVRGGQPSRITMNEDGLPVIQALERTRMRCKLSQVARWLGYRQIKNERVAVDANPPMYLAENILALPDWPFPPLLGITQAPILRPDGTICKTPGYDSETRLFYVPARGLAVPDIPDDPTAAQVSAARDILLDVLADFPFENETSRTNALSLVFSVLMRPAIPGNVPLLLIDAPVQGTGKTLLVKALGAIAVDAVPVQTVPSASRDPEEEWRKRITAILMESHPLVLIDNVPETMAFDSVNLAAALTSPEWIDRRLGKNETISVPSRCVWTATGNNIRVTGDMPRRCYTVRLDSNAERPWERAGFRHADLAAHVRHHRGRLLAAAYTLIRAWYAAGRPTPARSIRFGSFQEWADAVGGVLSHAGIGGFLHNLEEVRVVQDDDARQWNAFFAAWWETIGGYSVTTDEVCRRILAHESLTDEALPDILLSYKDKGMASLKRSLGRNLSRMAGRVFDGKKLSDAGIDTHAKVRRWKLRPLDCGVREVNPKVDSTKPTGFLPNDDQPCVVTEVSRDNLLPLPYTRANTDIPTHTCPHMEQGAKDPRKPLNPATPESDPEVLI